MPPKDEDVTTIQYQLTDPIVQHVYNMQNERNTDSLLAYCKNPFAKYRFVASQALASVQDSNAITGLADLLNDPVEEIRKNAAFALGQIGNIKAESALVAAFIPKDSTGPYLHTNATILEALGKCGSDSTLQHICNINTYRAMDTAMCKGQMLAFYRFGLRNKFCKDATKRALQIACSDSYPNEVRLIAAHFLQRFKQLDLKPFSKELKQAVIDEKDAELRMALVVPLARVGDSTAIQVIKELYDRKPDERILSNAMRMLQILPGKTGTSLAAKAINNDNPHISIPASEYFIEKGSEVMAEKYFSWSSTPGMHWQVRNNLLAAALKYIPYTMTITKGKIIGSLYNLYLKSSNPYEQASALKAMSKDVRQIEFIMQAAQSNKNAVVKTSSMEAVQSILANPLFELKYKGTINPIYPVINSYLLNVCNKADAGEIAAMSEFIGTTKYQIKRVITDSVMRLTLGKLKLPEEIESYNALSKAIATYKNAPLPTVKTADKAKAIDWKLLEQQKDTIFATIKTTAGDVDIALYPKLAPGSVANFIHLVNTDYFKDKIFHRVVPNFVVQTGCPRGDGYGSLDYMIRSEFAQIYYHKQGMIGMASAGKDTECSQFFITHSPCPHLDGKYSIFGEVTEGISQVMKIQQGDKITEVSVK